MKTPRWFITLALLFWGWETGLLLWAVVMAAVLEASHSIKARWELADSDLNRICDLCLGLFLGAGTLLYSREDKLVFIFKWAQWLPFCFYPVVLAQTYGDRPLLPLSAFSWLLRRIPQSPLSRISFNVSYAYYAVCLLGASASTQADQFFYIGVSVLILLALWSVRPNRVSWQAWITLGAVVLMCGRLSHQGLRQLQNNMETTLGAWIADWFRSTTDPREIRTHIGRGPIPLSAKIVLRLRVPAGEVPPSLLREGAYDSYRRGTWLSGTNDFTQIQAGSNGVARLLAPKKIYSTVEIAGYYPNGEGLLPLPHGTFQIEDFLVGVLRTNRLGVADVQAAPGMLDFQADYWTGPSFDSAPVKADLGVPDDETNVLHQVAASLGLDQMNERQKIRAVGRFFQDHFEYSLESPPPAGTNSPLGLFLTKYRRGHCEYFATATVLLLRQAGVPARYLTGYAVPESARHGETYLVRERYRHAWALVYHSEETNNPHWEQIDNTPSSWAGTAEASAPWWQSASDFMSNLYFQFSKWRWGKASISRYAQWALGPLILYLLWRILSTRPRQQNTDGDGAGSLEPVWPGLDSELFLINRRLAEVHLSRHANEPLSLWQQRLEAAFPSSPTLGSIFLMHHRLRFDPRGLPLHERETLRRQATEWLAEFSAQQAQSKLAGQADGTTK